MILVNLHGTNAMKYIFYVAGVTALTATAAYAQVRQVGPLTVYTAPQSAQTTSTVDFANAKPMPLPAATALPPSAADAIRQARDPLLIFGLPGASPGEDGSGIETPVELAAPQEIVDNGAQPEEFGTSGQPFTTSRAKLQSDNNLTTQYYPYRAAGKLFFNIGDQSFLCSASLIKPGIVVTAAHCVANFGHSQFYSNWSFVPAYANGSAPYGAWSVSQAWIKTAYFNGTMPCFQTGVICQSDIGILILNSQNGSYAGNATGWFGYGWDGWGFNGSSQALLTQLGYPVALDSGALMERTDSQGFINTTFSNNTIIGSLQTGGSSGGPWLANFGIPPLLSGTSFGSYASHNIVLGVTSWGYIDTTVKQQGASSFTSGNIVSLVNSACTSQPAAC